MRAWVTGLIVCVLVAVTGPAHANSRYAAVVVDYASGRVLHERNADKLLYPASLTKMMTLYMLFDALDDRKLRLDSRLAVSRRAAGMPASRLGLKRGTTISVEDAIRQTQIETHRLIRMQANWFREDDPRIEWVDGADLEGAVEAVVRAAGAVVGGDAAP